MAKSNEVAAVNQPVLPSQIANLGVLEWRAIRDRVAPQGTAVKATDMVGRTFTILRYRPYQSAFKENREIVYWIVAVTDDGELFNFTLGGTAVCDVLDIMDKLKIEHAMAIAEGKFARARELEDLGINKAWKFTLQWVEGGQGEGYYTFE